MEEQNEAPSNKVNSWHGSLCQAANVRVFYYLNDCFQQIHSKPYL